MPRDASFLVYLGVVPNKRLASSVPFTLNRKMLGRNALAYELYLYSSSTLKDTQAASHSVTAENEPINETLAVDAFDRRTDGALLTPL